MQTVTNIAAYQFARLSDLKPLRERLKQRCLEWNLKGTILLSPEGINLFVAGGREEIDELLTFLRLIPGLEGLASKYSESREQPFHRMLIKIKREIISFGVEGIDPANRPAPKLSPRQLKQWLDEGRPLLMLDTRNDYEIKLGTFRNATTLGINHFRQFPEAVHQLPDSWKHQPIVMFCTGGIRCEKAGPFMQRQGYENILQLDGGILKYFEECGNAHYDGECFVFDQRVGLDARLAESESSQCFACQSPLTVEERADQRFVEGESCPYCHETTVEQRSQNLVLRNDALRRAASPLPGRVPYENCRPLNVPLEYDHRTVLDFVCGILGHIPREDWQKTLLAGRIRKRTSDRPHATGRSVIVAADETVRAGDRLLHLQEMASEPDVNADIRILYEDEAIIVVNKPAPLPMHPCGRFNRNSLQYLLGKVYSPQSPRPAHRLDANTSGLVLFSRTRHFAKILQSQFDADAIEGVRKTYLARVHGHPIVDEFSCELPISDEPHELGARRIDHTNGLPARTEFRVIRRFADGTSLLEVIPITGRTNQIRIHLWSLNHAVCNDPTYLPGQAIGDCQTLSIDALQLQLLAWKIEFTHPVAKTRQSFEAELLPWCDGGVISAATTG